MRRTRRSFDIFNLSFLDVISCGFGAVVLLLVIIKLSEPEVAQTIEAALREQIAEQQRREASLIEASVARAAQIRAEGRTSGQLESRLRELEAALAAARRAEAEGRIEAAAEQAIVDQLAAALTEPGRTVAVVSARPPETAAALIVETP